MQRCWWQLVFSFEVLGRAYAYRKRIQTSFGGTVSPVPEGQLGTYIVSKAERGIGRLSLSVLRLYARQGAQVLGDLAIPRNQDM